MKKREILKLVFIGIFILSLNISTNVFAIFGEQKSKTVYVSASGTGNGENISAPASISYAISNIASVKEIILTDNLSYTNLNLPGNVTIRGISSDIILTLAGTVNLTDSLKLDNLKLSRASTFYANGYAFEITDSVTSSSRLTVYGGGNGKSVVSTNLKLCGGLYTRVYGGGNNAGVTGDTNVIFGGSANAGDGIDDSASDISPCYVFGGGNNGKVGGKTNVYLENNAVTKFLVGAGIGTNGTANDTNIYISGGKVMNVFGGSTSTLLPAGVNTHITMTGGMAEALFGGCESKSMTGNTYINLLGGEVTRRVYSGCYNDWYETFKSSNHVTGTTVLSILKTMSGKLNTGNGLSPGNSLNMGVFAGSRTETNYEDEHNFIIYPDYSYVDISEDIGEQTFASSVFKSHTDYEIVTSDGGRVEPTGNPGEIVIFPDLGKHANINDGLKAYYANDKAIVQELCGIIFYNAYEIMKADICTVAIATPDIDADGTLIAAIYESDGRFVECSKADYNEEADTYYIIIDCVLDEEKTYHAKFFLWDKAGCMSPVMNAADVSVNLIY